MVAFLSIRLDSERRGEGSVSKYYGETVGCGKGSESEGEKHTLQ